MNVQLTVDLKLNSKSMWKKILELLNATVASLWHQNDSNFIKFEV